MVSLGVNLCLSTASYDVDSSGRYSNENRQTNLLVANGLVTHHGTHVTFDEELTITLENMVVLTWLKLLHSDLLALVKQRYCTELISKTPASMKPEISQALDSLLEKIRSIADTKVLRTTASRFRQPPPRPLPKPSPQSWAPTKRVTKSCSTL